MAAVYALTVVTPERTVYQGPVEMLSLRGSEGELGILAHHIPLITAVKPCLVRIKEEGGTERRFAVGGGFLEVGREGTVLLADTAEAPDDIDRRRAEAARERAMDRLKAGGADVDVPRAKAALARAEARLKALGDQGP
jgi:F-type H+-transporting ATPase subunit epsilon